MLTYGVRKHYIVPVTFVRGYATAGSTDHHQKFNLHPWPKSMKPTPHEIFTVPSSDKDTYHKELKNMYQRYIKIYHPDISSNLTIFDHKSVPISADDKRQRFDQIQEAYDILKNPTRRQAYNTYQTTSWDNYNYRKSRTTANNFSTYRMANAHRRKYNFENDEAFWQAGTWEDYYRMRFNRSPPTQEEIDKNKYNILIGVLIVASLTTGLQVMLAIDKTNDFNRETALMNMRALQNIDASYNNYDEGTTRLQRLRRFLLFRRSAMIEREANMRAHGNEEMALEIRDKIKQDDLATIRRQHGVEDNELLQRYAQKRLQKLESEATE